MAAMATAVPDPRDIITPDAFRVADHLVGTPLARPWRRLGAILVDLLLVAILVGLLDAIGLLIALGGAFLVFRLSRRTTGPWHHRYFRRGLGCFGAVLVFTGTLVLLDSIGDDRPAERTETVSLSAAGTGGDAPAPEGGAGSRPRAADTATPPADTGVSDTAGVADTVLLAARDSLVRLRQEVRAVRADLAAERTRLEEAQARLEKGTLRHVLAGLADELGLGLGWLGLYFTAFTVLGRGQTPGKRLFRLRVIRLDGAPIGWWTSLQRFGGYSASVFTGLGGFAEVFWDDNRQALQDKLVHTVVVQEPKRALPSRPSSLGPTAPERSAYEVEAP